MDRPTTRHTCVVSILLLLIATVTTGVTKNTPAPSRDGSIPVAVVAGDFDADGASDAATISQTAGGGGSVILRFDRTGETRTVSLEFRPDMAAAGDLDADGVVDLVIGAYGAGRLAVLRGIGDGNFGAPQYVPLTGMLTALTVADVNRPDGLDELIAAVRTEAGSELLVFESTAGALAADPERIALPAPAQAVAAGVFRQGFLVDVAAACGSELIIVQGRDRKLHTPGVHAEAANVLRQSLDSEPLSIVAGRFENPSDGRVELAILSTNGSLTIQRVDDTDGSFKVVRQLAVGGSPTARIATQRGTDGRVDELMLIDPAASRVDAVDATPLAPQATFVVTNTGDGADAIPGDGVCDNGSGACTLRAAVQESNALAGADTINFALGAGTPSIAPASDLPAITSVVTVQGNTGGATRVEINGTSVASPNSGLRLAAGSSGSAIRNLVINRVPGTGAAIMIESASNTVEGCWIGLDALGSTTVNGNPNGIVVSGAAATNNAIGGTTAAQRNVISHNTGAGIRIEAGASSNIVQGNYIGTSAGANLAAANTGDGVVVTGASTGNLIGGSPLSAGLAPGNVISGNTGSGVNINGNGSTGNLVQGNFIGVNGAGLTAIGNAGDGIIVQSSAASNTIGGTLNLQRNIISGNGGAASDGVELNGVEVTGTNVFGNYVGLDVNGTNAIPNGLNGILVAPGTEGNTIGAATSAPGSTGGNVISGNGAHGISVRAANTLIQGNIIGLRAAGNAAQRNIADGIAVTGNISGTMIGGTLATQRNVISGQSGVSSSGISGGDGKNITIQSNYIGTDVSGANAIGNTYGIRSEPTGGSAPSGLMVGGPASTPGTPPGNVISGNVTAGLLLSINSATLQGNLIGLNAGGTAAVGNGTGVLMALGGSHLIGGTADGTRNVISGNVGTGVDLSSLNTVWGNYIGTDITGVNAVPNTTGIVVRRGGNFIGGTTSAPGLTPGNVVSGNTQNGVEFGTGSIANSNQVRGNIIGATRDGMTALPNRFSGVFMLNMSHTNVIGGTVSGDRNLISGNSFNATDVGVYCLDCSNGSAVRGNWIGVRIDGTTALPNGIGVLLGGSTPSLSVGGPNAGEGNVIAGNLGSGVLSNSATTGNSPIQGNLIGIAPDGVSPLGNGRYGVEATSSAPTVGGTTGITPGACTGSCNTIKFNALGGVRSSNAAFVRGNSISDNTGLGIDLGAAGVTPNDAGDTTTPQNFPVISSLIFNSGAGTSTISGTVASGASRTLAIEVFSNAVADPSGSGEGAVLLGTATCLTGATGTGAWSLVVNGNPPNVTATATFGSSTSEFATTYVDSDADGYGNSVDNCPGMFNPDQIDSDFDNHGDPCDCAPSDPGAVEPLEIAGLAFDDDKQTLSWSPDPSGDPSTLYDIVRGEIASLPVDGGASESCLATGVATPSASDAGPIVPGQVFWYVSRTRRSCGIGTYGAATGGVKRTSGVCP